MFPDHQSIISGSFIPLATIREMIETEETEANLDAKEWSDLLKFQTASEHFDSGYGHDSDRHSISMLRYNQEDTFVIKVSGYKEKILMFQLYN